MGVVDNFLKKMKMVNEEDEYDDYDDYDDYEDDEEILPKKKPEKQKKTRVKERSRDEDLDDFDDFEEKVTASAERKAAPKKTSYTQSSYAGSGSSYSQNSRQNVVGMNRGSSSGSGPEVCMVMPKSFDDANTIAELLLQRKAVVLNLEGIDMSAAQRIIDFASGACYTVGGNLQKISKKIFIVVPQNMNLSGDFDELMGDMVDLSALAGNM